MKFANTSLVLEARQWLQLADARVEKYRSSLLEPNQELLDGPLELVLAKGNAEIAAHVAHLCLRRAALLEGKALSSTSFTIEGRLLTSRILESVIDGASEDASAGWFDRVDLPPWDTWLCFVPLFPERHPYEHALISYVPEHSMNAVERGIGVNPIDCHEWTSASDVVALDTLYKKSLMGSS